jgi:hypothetical protein
MGTMNVYPRGDLAPMAPKSNRLRRRDWRGAGFLLLSDARRRPEVFA